MMTCQRTDRLTKDIVLTLVATLGLMSGCDVDSFADPSNTVRMEATPVVLPILDRLDVIDEPLDEIIGLSEITPEDHRVEPVTYVVGPGDVLTITIYALLDLDQTYERNHRVDEMGNIDLPIVHEVPVAGLTAKEVEDVIVQRLIESEQLMDPIVSVFIEQRQQRTFTILGVPQAGPYLINKTEFRVIDAIGLGGGLPANVEKLYVFRRVTIQPEKSSVQSEDIDRGTKKKNPVDVLEELVDPNAEPQAQAQPIVEPTDVLKAAVNVSHENQEPIRYINVDGEWVLMGGTSGDILDEEEFGRNENASGNNAQPAESEGNPKGLQSETRQQAANDPAEEVDAPEREAYATQRVIEIDARALLRGEERQNIIIRPNDVIRVPEPVQSFVYIEGEIIRPGAYNLSSDNPMTLTALVASAGGLGPFAIPERVDLYRRIGKDQQAIVRLNYRAIIEGLTPNILLKPHDEIRIGTNVYASHLAVIRNGFRMTYGFGFLLDRNFGNDVFGPPPIFRSRGNILP